MIRADTWHGRLYCQFFFVDARVTRHNGRWSASVDTPEGPTLAWGRTALSALIEALEPFEGMSMELVHSAPSDLVRILES
jgi:hypothetical protein